MATHARKTVATALSAAELAELDRVCERQDVSRAEAMRTAIRWFIGAAGRLPAADAATPEEIGGTAELLVRHRRHRWAGDEAAPPS
jgi:hypothetical protein